MSIFSAPAPGFYGAADKAIYDQGFSFIPQEMYREAFVAPTFPTAPTTGGITTVPTTTALDVGGNRDDNNPFNPNMDQIRTDFDSRPFNLAMRDTEKFGSTVGPNPDLFFAPQSKIGGIIDLIPGIGGIKRGLNIIGGMLPINQRAILENEARGQGIFTDDIGRIVGDPDTVGGVMAGYNLSKMTEGTFDKRLGTIGDTLKDKYGIDVTAEGFDPSDIDEDDPAYDLVGKYGRIGKAKLGFIDSKRRAKIIEDQRIADQKEKERLAKIEKEKQRAKNLQARLAKARRDQKDKIKGFTAPTKQGQSPRGSRIGGGFTAPTKPGQSPRGSRTGVRDQNPSRDHDGGASAAAQSDRAAGMGGYMKGGRVYYMDGGLADLVDIYD